MSRAKAPADYGPIQLPNHLRLKPWQFEEALARGLIPAPDLPNGRWSAALVATLDPEIIRAEVPAHPNIGSARAAELLARMTGLDVGYADSEVLAERGLLAVRGRYKGWPLYDGDQLHAFADDQAAVDTLRVIIAERQTWLAASMTRLQAAGRLGWRPKRRCPDCGAIIPTDWSCCWPRQQDATTRRATPNAGLPRGASENYSRTYVRAGRRFVS